MFTSWGSSESENIILGAPLWKKKTFGNSAVNCGHYNDNSIVAALSETRNINLNQQISVCQDVLE
jgi:hypothetical protein